jgi:hypothetical protein
LQFIILLKTVFMLFFFKKKKKKLLPPAHTAITIKCSELIRFLTFVGCLNFSILKQNLNQILRFINGRSVKIHGIVSS